jgi:mannose/fructose-specific phosphotransferase system component IIA
MTFLGGTFCNALARLITINRVMVSIAGLSATQRLPHSLWKASTLPDRLRRTGRESVGRLFDHDIEREHHMSAGAS